MNRPCSGSDSPYGPKQRSAREDVGEQMTTEGIPTRIDFSADRKCRSGPEASRRLANREKALCHIQVIRKLSLCVTGRFRLTWPRPHAEH